MIQPALPSSPLAAAMAVDAMLQGAATGAEGPDFANLLAASLPGMEPGEEPAASAAALALPIPAATEAAIQVPATGKMLPPAMPEIAAARTVAEADAIPVVAIPVQERTPKLRTAAKAQVDEGTAQVAMPKDPGPAPAAKVGQARRAAGHDTVRMAERAAGDEPEADGEASGEGTSAQPAPARPSITPIPLAAPDMPGAAVPAAQVTAPPASAPPPDPRSAADTAPLSSPSRPVPASPEPAPRELAKAAPQAAFLRAQSEAQGAAVVADQPRQAEQKVQQSAPLLRVEIAAPAPAPGRPAEPRPLQRRTAASAPTATEGVIAPDVAGQQAAPTASAPTVPAPIGPVASAAAALRPYDFSALVDRLVAAREAVQPQPATLTVAHAEFGPVELRFRHEERGLAVSLASADPDFARAAAAAPQPAIPAGPAPQSEGVSTTAQRDTSAATSSSGGQPRGQTGERRGEQSPQSNPGHRAPARPGSERRSGIFA